MKTLFVLLMGLSSFSQAAALKCDPTLGKVSFEAVGKPSFMKIKGEAAGPEGDLVVDKTVTGTFKFKLDSLKTGIDMRDQHMKEKYLQTSKHPTAELKVEEVKNFDPAKTEQTLPFKGQLTLHGVQKPVSGNVEIKKQDAGYKVKANFETKITDYGIDVPSYSGITVTDTVKVAVETQLK